MDLENNYKHKMGNGYVDAYKMLMNVRGLPAVYIKQGTENTVDLSQYFGGNKTLTYIANVSTDDKSKLGMTFSVNGEKMTITCTNEGAADLHREDFDRRYAGKPRGSRGIPQERGRKWRLAVTNRSATKHRGRICPAPCRFRRGAFRVYIRKDLAGPLAIRPFPNFFHRDHKLPAIRVLPAFFLVFLAGRRAVVR